jgi:hypothetical protein
MYSFLTLFYSVYKTEPYISVALTINFKIHCRDRRITSCDF